MELKHFEYNPEATLDSINLRPGTYKVIAIGPGGDGTNGNKATGDNSAKYGTVDGADGAGGGAGGVCLCKYL